MTEHFVLERTGDIGVIAVENHPVHVPESRFMHGLMTAVERFADEPSLEALVIMIAGRAFATDAEIGRLAGRYDPAAFRAILARIELLDRPVVAALHGTVAGAGLELAMACHSRIATADCRMGLPEVLLGLVPSAMGTQRLARLAGAEAALAILLSGEAIDARAAMRIGLIDAIADADLGTATLAHAISVLQPPAQIRRTSEIAIAANATPERLFVDTLLNAARQGTATLVRQCIVRCVEAAMTVPFDAAGQIEAALSEQCRSSLQSQALRYLHIARRNAAVVPHAGAAAALRLTNIVGIVGAGTMGGGIAMNFANAGIPTIVVETSEAALQRGLDLVRKNYEASAAKGRLTAEQVAQRMALLHGSVDYLDLAGCDLVIEAVFENMDVKKQVCARLGQVCKPGAIIASNTSTLDVDELALATGRAADVIGMHFFSPANVMRLLEVVRGARTDASVLTTVMQLARRIGKVPVVSGVCYGFIGNRMLEPYLRESEFLLMEGASPAQIDGAIETLGLAMGPCRMLDMAGLDVGAKVVLERRKAGGLPPDPSYRAVVQRMHALGRHGQKTALGYYRYDGRKAVPDPALQDLCQALAAEHGIARRTNISDQEIVERCLYPLMNEGACILAEGIAYRPSDIDVVWTEGYGFPEYLGGPVFMADQLGLRTITARLQHYAQMRGNAFDYWTVSALLQTLAARGDRLSEYMP